MEIWAWLDSTVCFVCIVFVFLCVPFMNSAFFFSIISLKHKYKHHIYCVGVLSILQVFSLPIVCMGACVLLEGLMIKRMILSMMLKLEQLKLKFFVTVCLYKKIKQFL